MDNTTTSDYKWTKAKWESECSECEALIQVGDKMLWKIGTKKIYCVECGNEFEPERKNIVPRIH